MNRELIKTKIFSILIIGLGALSVPIEYDGTFFVLTLIVGIPIFFCKEDTFDCGDDDAVNNGGDA